MLRSLLARASHRLRIRSLQRTQRLHTTTPPSNRLLPTHRTRLRPTQPPRRWLHPTFTSSLYPSSSNSSHPSNPSAPPTTAYKRRRRKPPPPPPSPSLVSNEDTLKAISRAIAGNLVITALKFGVYLSTRSSAMLAETIHTLVDLLNQCLLLVGSKQAAKEPNERFPRGRQRSSFFWSLVSALGTFWLGAGVSVAHGVHTLLDPPAALEITWHTWAVLLTSFTVDGSVLHVTLRDLKKTKPEGKSLMQYVRELQDPLMAAVVLEDVAATTGVVVAASGIGMSIYTGNTMWDGLASVGVGCILGTVALLLVAKNHYYLLGATVDNATKRSIARILYDQPSIEAVYNATATWRGTHTFAYHAEVDWDGAYFARKLEAEYRPLFAAASEHELSKLMESYAEAVTRMVENEVVAVEEIIQRHHPEAEFIELEPASMGVFSSLPEGHRKLVLEPRPDEQS